MTNPKKKTLLSLTLLAAACLPALAQTTLTAQDYVPTPENVASRQAFAENTWGYGDGPRTVEEFYTASMPLPASSSVPPHIAGFYYTQFTDVEQEQNGIYSYDRTPKFDMERIRTIFSLTPDTK